MQELPFVLWASLVTQTVKNLPAMQETWIRSLGWEDPLEEGMALYSPAFMPGESHVPWWATVHMVIKSGTRLSD